MGSRLFVPSHQRLACLYSRAPGPTGSPVSSGGHTALPAPGATSVSHSAGAGGTAARVSIRGRIQIAWTRGPGLTCLPHWAGAGIPAVTAPQGSGPGWDQQGAFPPLRAVPKEISSDNTSSSPETPGYLTQLPRHREPVLQGTEMKAPTADPLLPLGARARGYCPVRTLAWR